MRQPNGCSTPAPKSSAAKQWIKGLAQTKEVSGTHPSQEELCLTAGSCSGALASSPGLSAAFITF